jgi:repressor LexA
MELTGKQQEVLQYIQNYFAQNGIVPSVREIAKALGKSAQAIQQLIETLRAKGHLHHQPQKSRANVPVLSHLFAPHQIVEVPILGRVQAGLPLFAEENLEGVLPLPREWARDERVFMLRVKGDSMQDAHIMPDDLAIIRQQPVAENGKIVVARVNESEVTLKRFFLSGDKVILKPENPRYEPLEKPAGEVEIIGKLIGVFRKYD